MKAPRVGVAALLKSDWFPRHAAPLHSSVQAMAADGSSMPDGCSAACAAAPEPAEIITREMKLAVDPRQSKAAVPVVGRGRGRPSLRPKIDIDADIEEAHRLAELFKKMNHVSKVVARNAVKSKQRLMRKANKLSAQDLMRLAVLKRCGFVEQHPETVEEAHVGADAATPVQLGEGCNAKSTMGVKLSDMMSGVPGATELLKSLEASVTSALAVPRATSGSAPSGHSAAQPSVCRKGLKRLPCRPLLESRKSQKPASEDPTQAEAGALADVEGSGTEEAASNQEE